MKTLVQNRRARFDYRIDDELVAGIELTGSETKSLKNSQGSLNGAHVAIRNGEAFLVHLHISPYAKGGPAAKSADPERIRKLLLNRNEIEAMNGKQKGSIIVPLEIVQTPRGFVKVRIGIGFGKKQYDKRETLKRRDVEKQIRQEK